MQLLLTKQFSFEMAHALPSYDGKCSNIHGHSYKLFVTVEGEPMQGSPKSGMVVDFGDLKHIVVKHLVEPFDHALVLPRIGNESPTFAGYGAKLVLTDFQPTTENLLLHFARLLQDKMPQGVRLHALRLYETESSCAELIL